MFSADQMIEEVFYVLILANKIYDLVTLCAYLLPQNEIVPKVIK